MMSRLRTGCQASTSHFGQVPVLFNHTAEDGPDPCPTLVLESSDQGLLDSPDVPLGRVEGKNIKKPLDAELLSTDMSP